MHPDWFGFRDAIARDRCLYFSANATRPLCGGAVHVRTACLIFGNETDGMPARILEKHPERCFRIPMPGEVRSLNLANAVSVVLYEGLRRIGAPVPVAGPVEAAQAEGEPRPAGPTKKRQPPAALIAGAL